MNIIDKILRGKISLTTPDGTDIGSDNPSIIQLNGVDYVVGRSGVDKATEALMVVSYGHHEVHEGNSFLVTLADSDFDKSDTMNICFKTPDTDKLFHVYPIITCTVPALFEILEGPTVTNGSGSDLTVINRRFDSANTSGALNIEASPSANTVSTNCTITGPGTIKDSEILGAGKNTIGDSGLRDENERILKKNTIYAFRITGAGVTDNGVAGMKISWYEHTDKN